MDNRLNLHFCIQYIADIVLSEMSQKDKKINIADFVRQSIMMVW